MTTHNQVDMRRLPALVLVLTALCLLGMGLLLGPATGASPSEASTGDSQHLLSDVSAVTADTHAHTHSSDSGVTATAEPGVTSIVAQPSVTAEQNLSLLSPQAGNVANEDYERVTLDVSNAVATDAQRLDGAVEREAYDQHQATLTGVERDEFETETKDRIAHEVESLDATVQELVQDYNAGSISTQYLLDQLLVVNVAVEEYRSLAAHVVDDESDLPAPVYEEVVTFDHPVSELLEATATDRDGLNTYLQTTNDALVVVVPGEEQLRQATHRGYRDKTEPDRFDGEPFSAWPRIQELYPHADAVSGRIAGPSDDRINTVYEFEFTNQILRGGEEVSVSDATTYLDGGTAEVFHEIQWFDSPVLADSTTVTEEYDDIEVAINTSIPTGPMKVNVTDAATGDQVDADVYVDGVRIDEALVGTTEEGPLWTAQPLGSFDVTIEPEDAEPVTLTGL